MDTLSWRTLEIGPRGFGFPGNTRDIIEELGRYLGSCPSLETKYSEDITTT